MGSSMVFAYISTSEIASVYVVVNQDTLKLKLPHSDFYPGDKFTMEFETFERGNPNILSWVSSDETIATVNGSGEVTILNTGTVTITASNNTYGLEDSVTFTSKDHFVVLSKNTFNVGRRETIAIFDRYSRNNIIEWTSTNENIAVGDGTIFTTGDIYGSATLTGTSKYLDEDIVITVNVTQVVKQLSSPQYTVYSEYLKISVDLYKVSVSLGYDWYAVVSIEMVGLWEANSNITIVMDFPFSNGVTTGTMKKTFTITQGSSSSSPVDVVPVVYNNNPVTDTEIKPTGTVTFISGSVKK